jgi:hypothetical protein
MLDMTVRKEQKLAFERERALTHVGVDCLDGKVHVDKLQILAEPRENSVTFLLNEK